MVLYVPYLPFSYMYYHIYYFRNSLLRLPLYKVLLINLMNNLLLSSQSYHTYVFLHLSYQIRESSHQETTEKKAYLNTQCEYTHEKEITF